MTARAEAARTRAGAVPERAGTGRAAFPGAAALLVLAALASSGRAAPDAPAGSAAAGKEASGRPAFRDFDDTLFTVAYDVFLAARNVREAFELAREAVRQRPEIPAWRERLARTAEWAGEPLLSMREWEYLGVRARRPEAFREAIRLASALGDHVAAVRLWEGLAGLRELDAAEWVRLLEAYEGGGEPGRGAERLRRRLAARPDRTLSLALAELLQRVDRDREALAVLEGMLAAHGNSAAIGLRRAGIYCRQGRIREAAAVLDAVGGLPATAAEREALLRLQASAYTWLQRYGDALSAYRELFEGGRYDESDLRDLHGLARDRDADLALSAAVAGWTRFQDPDLLVYYLEQCLEADRWDLASRAVSRLSPEQWALFADTPYFFALAARIHQREGKAALARREHRRALALEPASEEYQAGYLWLLIEQGRMDELGAWADRWARGPATPPALVEPLAMAYKVLQRPRTALAYFRLLDEGSEHADFPFLMSYAEILEQVGDGQGAARAYLRARSALRSPPGAGEGREDREERADRDWQEALARWAWKFESGDAAERRIAALVSANQGSAGTKELAFSWRVARGQNPEDAMAAAGGRRRYREAAFPAWARLAVAIRAEDAGRVAALLEDRESGLGAEDKARAAAFLGLRGEAARHARDAGPARFAPPEAGGLAARRGAPGLEAGYAFADHAHFEEHRAAATGEAALGAGTLLIAGAETRRRPWISGRLSVPAPDREDAGTLGLRHATRRGATRLSAGFRSTAASARGGAEEPILTLSAEQEWRPVRLLAVHAAYDGNAVADENPILALLGAKDRWQAGLRLFLPAGTELGLSASRVFFHAWDGRRLGEGGIVQAGAERRFRNLGLGTGLAFNGFGAAADRLGPQGTPLVGGLLAAGEFPRTFWQGTVHLDWSERAPVRSWRPSPSLYAELGRNLYPASGAAAAAWSDAFALRAGLAASPAAAQRVILQAAYAGGLRSRDGTESGISLRYAYTLR